MGALNEIAILLKASGGDQVVSETRKVTSATETMSSMMGKVEGAIKGVAAAFSAYKMLDYARDAAMLAARVETLSVVMKVVGANAGYTGSQMDVFTSGLKKMGITTQESMSSLIKMAGAQMDLTKANQLARVAQDAAVIGGINSSEAFGRMIQGIRSGEVEILKTIGINVQFEAAYQKTAATLGKTSKELTDTEKTAARMNAVLAFGTNIAGAYEASMSTAGKQMLSMSRYTEELKLQIGQTFSPALTSAVGALTSALKFVSNNFEQLKIVAMAASAVIIGIGAGIVATNLVAWATTAAAAFTALRISIAATAGASAAGNLVMIGGSAAMSMFGMATAGATVAMNALKVAFMTNPVGIIIGTLTIAIGLWMTYKKVQSDALEARVPKDNPVLVSLRESISLLETKIRLLKESKGLESITDSQLAELQRLKMQRQFIQEEGGGANARWQIAGTNVQIRELEAGIRKEAALKKEVSRLTPVEKPATGGSTTVTETDFNKTKAIGDALRAWKESFWAWEDAGQKVASKAAVDLLTWQHEQNLISTKAYIDQKEALEKGVIEREIQRNNNRIKEMQGSLAITMGPGDDPNGDQYRKHAEAQTQLNNALTKGLELKAQLNGVEQAAGIEREKDTIKETTDRLKELNDEWQRQLNVKKDLDSLQAANDATGASLVGTNASGDFDSIADQIANQLAVQQDAHEKRMKMIEDERNANVSALMDGTKSYANYATKIVKLDDQAALERKKNSQATTKIQQDSIKSQLSMVANYVGVGAQLFQTLADAQDQSSREGFEAAKDYNTAAAAMSMAAGIIGAFAGNGTMYEKLANAAIVLATGMAQISAIQSTTFGGGAASASIASGTTAGAGANGGGIAGSSIGARYVSIEDSQTTESLQKLADSADNASMAIGKIVNGFSKIEGIFSEGGYASMFAGSAYGIDKQIKSSPSPFTAQNMSLFTSGTGLVGNLLFGLGNKFQYKGSAMMLGGNSSNVAVADVDEYRRKGGMFGGGKTKYDIKYDAEWSKFMQGLVDTIGTSVQRMAITMGTKANVAGVALPGMVIQTTGRTPEQISADIQKWLQNVAANLAKTVPELEKFAFAGENYYLALTRLNDALVSTNQALQQIGAGLIESTLSGANFAYKLQELMGGAEAFAEKIDTYFTGMFTEAEQNAAKVAAAQRQVDNAFAEMGATGITTRAQFKALVNSLDLTTEFGARTFAALMDIAGAFSIVTEEAEKAARALIDSLVDTALNAAQALKDIMGGSLSTKSPTEIYNEQRKAFTDALAAGRTAELPELGKALLEVSQKYNASGTAYSTDYDMVTKALMELAGLTGEPTIDKVQAQINILTDIRDALEMQNEAQLKALSGMLGTSSPLYVALHSYLQQMATAQTTTDAILNSMKIADLNKQLTSAQGNVTSATATKANADAALASYDSPEVQFWMRTHGFSEAVIQAGRNMRLSDVATAAQQLQAAMDAVAALQAQLAALTTLPSYAVGTPYLAQDGPIYAHQGEIIMDRQSSDVLRKYGIPTSGIADNRELIDEIRALRAEVAELKGHAEANVQVNQAGFGGLIKIGEKQARSGEVIANKASLERQAA